jgi:hypothetical protein
MEQTAGVKIYVKLKETTTETFEMLKNAYGECEQVSLNGVNGSKKGESCYKTINAKAVLELPEHKNRQKSFRSVWPKI